MKRTITALILVAMWQVSFGSEESANPLDEFKVSWVGTEDFGEITAKGSLASDGKIDSVKIFVFGRDIALSEEILGQLDPGPFNGISLSSEPGYSEVGGRTIYLQFSMGHSDGVKRAVIIAVSENGDVRVL